MLTLELSAEQRQQLLRSYWREQHHKRRGYRIRPVGRPRKAVLVENADTFDSLAAKFPPCVECSHNSVGQI